MFCHKRKILTLTKNFLCKKRPGPGLRVTGKIIILEEGFDKGLPLRKSRVEVEQYCAVVKYSTGLTGPYPVGGPMSCS